MPLSDSVLAELRQEIDLLRRERDRLDERIEAIERVIGETRPQAAVSVSAGLPNASSAFGPTVKGVVLQALKENPGVKAAAITSYLRKIGFRTNGPTRLSHRVYNELWRMSKDGEIIRTPDGRFMPK